MKTIFIALLLFIASTLSLKAQSIDEIMERYSDSEQEATYVTISKSLLQMATSSQDKSSSTISIGETKFPKEMVSSIDMISILTVDGEAAASKLHTQIESVVKSRRFETLVKVRESGEKVDIMASRSNDTIRDLIIRVRGAEEYTLIYMSGSFTDDVLTDLSDM